MPEPETLPYALPRLADAEAIARARALAERLKMRRTCRWFSDAPVPREVIEAPILAAGSAPSGANHQPWHFAVVASPERKRAIRK
ncbi:MAG: iodotyrosine deiodinase, partial [Porphyrobacter sp. HL-46]